MGCKSNYFHFMASEDSNILVFKEYYFRLKVYALSTDAHPYEVIWM